MNKYNNPRLLNTVVSGTGMKNPVRPHVIIGSEENGFIRGDLMDANAIQELIVTEIAAREHGDEELTEYIDEKIQLAVDDLVDGAPEVLDTLKELSEALGDDANFATTITEEIASKVDKVEGKGLSTNDYTTAEKQKLAGIAAGAEVNVQSDWSLTNSSNDAFIKNKPTKLSQFENDVPYATESELIETKNIVDILYKTDVDLFDILYDDGTVSSDILTPSSGKTPVGICVGIAADFEDGKARFMALKYGSTIYPNGVTMYSQSMGTNMPFLDDELFEDLPLYNYISQDCLQDVNGNLNTDIILNSSNPSKYIAANVCRQFDPGYKVGEWYLPSMGELHLMYSNKVKILAVITELRNAGYNNIAEIDENVPSMSSTEKDDSYIFVYAPLLTNNPAVADMKNTSTASGFLVRPFLAITPQCRGKVVDIEKDVEELKENLTSTETTDLKSNEEVIAAALNNLNTKIEATNIRFGLVPSLLEELSIGVELSLMHIPKFGMPSDAFNAIFTEANSTAINHIILRYAPTFYVGDSSGGVVTCSIVRSATQVCVFRNKVDEQSGNAIQEFILGTIGVDGTIAWANWANISSTAPKPLL